MAFTIEDIKVNWLVDGSIPYSEDVVVDAFNEVISTLGQEYLDKLKYKNGVELFGPYITISVIDIGLKMFVLKKGVNNFSLIKKLTSKLEVEKTKGLAELNAIYFLCSAEDIEFELEPQVLRPNKTPSKPDFRLKRLTDSQWTYIEVKQPDTSEENKTVQIVIEKIQKLFDSYDNYLSVEIMLLRIPTENELNLIVSKCSELFNQIDKKQLEIDDLGLIKINQSVSLVYTPSEYIGFLNKPCYASMQTVVGLK